FFLDHLGHQRLGGVVDSEQRGTGSLDVLAVGLDGYYRRVVDVELRGRDARDGFDRRQEFVGYRWPIHLVAELELGASGQIDALFDITDEFVERRPHTVGHDEAGD